MKLISNIVSAWDFFLSPWKQQRGRGHRSDGARTTPLKLSFKSYEIPADVGPAIDRVVALAEASKMSKPERTAIATELALVRSATAQLRKLLYAALRLR